MTTTNINIVQKLKNEIKQSVPGQNFEFEVKNETVELFGRTVEIARVHFKATDEYNVGWVVDQHAPNCMRCDAAFSYFFKLKHHCRKCGYLVCDPCSVHRLKVLNISEPGESRACTHCYNVHIAEMKAKKDASKPETSVSSATESGSEKVSQPVVSSEQSQENPVVTVNTVNNNSTSVTHVTSTTENSSNTTINNSKENTSSPQASATSTANVSVSSNAAPSREIVDKVQSSRQREEEEKRAKLSETKQHKLNEFLGDNVDENLSIAERDAQRTRAEQERQAKFEEEKKAKLIAFLKVEGYEHSSEFKNMSVTERAELTRLKAEEEKTAKLEQEKQAKLAAFLAQDKDGHPVEKSPEGGNRKSVSDRYENAKRIQHNNEEERMATLKRDPSRSVISKEGSPTSAFSSPVSGRKQLNSAKSSPDVTTVTVTTTPVAVEHVTVVSTTAANDDSAVVSVENHSSSDFTVSSSAAEKEEENAVSTEVVAQSASESHHETHSEQHTATSHVVITQRVTTTTKSSTVVETHSHAHRSHRLADRIHEHHAENSSNHSVDHPVIDTIVSSHRAEVQQEEVTPQTESSTTSSETVVLNAENHAPVSVVEVTVTVAPAEPVVEEPVSPVVAPATDDVAEGRVSTSPVEEERPSEVGGEERESVSEVKDGAVSVKTGKKNNKKGKKNKK